MSTGFPRDLLVAGLRALADFLEDHPAAPTPRTVTAYHFARLADDGQMRDEIDHIASWLGTEVEDDGGHYATVARFGPVTYKALAILAEPRARYEAHASYRSNFDPAPTA